MDFLEIMNFFLLVVFLFLFVTTYSYVTKIDEFYSIKMLKWFIFVCCFSLIVFFILYYIYCTYCGIGMLFWGAVLKLVLILIGFSIIYSGPLKTKVKFRIFKKTVLDKKEK